MAERICIGFGEQEGRCQNIAGTPWTPLWCGPCDEARRAHISRQLENIAASFKSDASHGSEDQKHGE